MATHYIHYVDSPRGDGCYLVDENSFQAALLAAERDRSCMLDFTFQSTGRGETKTRIVILVEADQTITRAVRMRAMARSMAVLARCQGDEDGEDETT